MDCENTLVLIKRTKKENATLEMNENINNDLSGMVNDYLIDTIHKYKKSFKGLLITKLIHSLLTHCWYLIH